MKLLSASVGLLVAAVMATAHADHEYAASNVKLLAAKKTYMLGDGKYFDSSSVSNCLQQATSYVTLGGGEVQGFQKMTGTQTQSLPSWSWNSTWPLENGVSTVMDVGVTNMFYFNGPSVTMKPTSNSNDNYQAYPFGLADASTGAVQWIQWVKKCQPIVYKFNSTHLFANAYDCDKSNARQYSTINLMTKGYLVNLTLIPEQITVTKAAVLTGWSSKTLAYVTGYGSGVGGNMAYNLFAFGEKKIDYTMLNVSNSIQMGLSAPLASDATTLALVNGDVITPVTIDADYKMTNGTDIDFVGSARVWTAPFQFVAVGGNTNVYTLLFGELTSLTIYATGNSNMTNVTQNWQVGSSLALFGGGAVIGNGYASGANAYAFFLNNQGSTLYKIMYTNTSTPDIVSLAQDHLPGNKIAAGSCMISATDVFSWVCRTVPGTSEYPLVATVSVKNTLQAKTGVTAMWPTQTGFYQPSTGTFVLELLYGTSMPMVAEAGVISEISTLAQDQYTPMIDQPTMTMRAGNTLIWYNTSTVWGWSMSSNSMSLISNVWNSTNFTINGLLGADANTIYVSVKSTVLIADVPANTYYICRVPVSTSAAWTNIFGASSATSDTNDCFRTDNFGVCGSNAGISPIGDSASVVSGSLWFTIGSPLATNGGQCLVKLTSTGVASGTLFATYFQEATTVSQTSMTQDVCTSDKSECGLYWTYATIKRYQIAPNGAPNAIVATLGRSGSYSSPFYTEMVVQIPLSALVAGQVYRGTPQMYQYISGRRYWQLPGPSYGGSTSGSSSSTNFVAIAKMTQTSEEFQTEALFHSNYWYFGVKGTSLYCYSTTVYSSPVWKMAMSLSTSAAGIYAFQSLIYLEGDKSIATFVPQQPGSQIPVKTWEGPSENTLVNYGQDGSLVLTDDKYVASFSFLGKGNWESPMCYNGARVSSSTGGRVNKHTRPMVQGSTVDVTCNPSTSTTSRVAASLRLYGGDVVQRWNYGKGITATPLGSFTSGPTIYNYYFITIGGNHSFTRIAVPLNAPKPKMAQQYNSNVAPITPTTPISGLGLENWNNSFSGNQVQLTDTGFGNVYTCGTNPSSSNNKIYVAGFSGATGKQIWSFNKINNVEITSCSALKALGPAVVFRSGNNITALNAMTGRALYAWVPLTTGWTNMNFCNDATIFYWSQSTLYYMSVSSGKQYTILNLGDAGTYFGDQMLQSTYSSIATTSAIVIATKDYVFWCTAFGEVRTFYISQTQAYGQTSGVSARPQGDYAVVIRSGHWQNDFPMFPRVNGQLPNTTTAVLCKWSGSTMPWTKSIVPNEYARARLQTSQASSGSGSFYAIDWGMKGTTPVVLFVEARWIQGLYVSGTMAGTSAYGSGVQFWWLKMSPLLPVTNNLWYLTDERSNFHTFDVNAGSFKSSFQLQAPATETFPNIFRPQGSLLQGIAVTTTSIFVAWEVATSQLGATGSNQVWIYRIDLDKIGTSTPTEAFASVYMTGAPLKKIGTVMDTNMKQTVVVVGEYQLAAVDFKTGRQIISYPAWDSGIIAWNYNSDLTKFYTATTNTYAQGVSSSAGVGSFTWNVTLNSMQSPVMLDGNTFGVAGYLSNDATKYVVTTNNAAVCVFNAATGAGYFTGKTCMDLRTISSSIGKQCTFTNTQSLGSFFTESDGNLYFSSSSSNCIFKIALSTITVSAFKFQYSFSHAPVSTGGNLFFSDGMYVYKIKASDFSATVGSATPSSVLAQGATRPLVSGSMLYVGYSMGLLQIDPTRFVGTWNYQTAGRIVRPPVAIGGNILVGDSTGYIYAVKTTGALYWSLKAGYNAAQPNQENQVLATLASNAAGTFLWITNNGIVAYGNDGSVIWSDFKDRSDRQYQGRYSFSVGRIFPIEVNCDFVLSPDLVTLYAKCGTALVARNIATGQILFATGMPGSRFAIAGSTMTYPGNTKIVEQNFVLPAVATPAPGFTPVPTTTAAPVVTNMTNATNTTNMTDSSSSASSGDGRANNGNANQDIVIQNNDNVFKGPFYAMLVVFVIVAIVLLILVVVIVKSKSARTVSTHEDSHSTPLVGNEYQNPNNLANIQERSANLDVPKRQEA